MRHSTALKCGLFVSLLPASVAGLIHAQTGAPPRAATPVEPIAAILETFRSHRVVMLGEGAHGNEQGHTFRLSLIRDPRFMLTVNDIVVECGNARYQDLMDRFVRGEDVPNASLRAVWQNTTVEGPAWDKSIYEEFFRAVRALNASLPRQRQLRVLLGDPPIDWDAVHGPEDVLKWQKNRDTYPADLIRREVLEKQRRALVIYGDGHLLRVIPDSLAGSLASTAPTEVFTISTNTDADLTTLQADVATWRVPSLAILRGTVFGVKPLAFYFGPAPFDGPMEDRFDAILYIGPPSTIRMTPLVSPALCADSAYMEMRMRRMALMPGAIGRSGIDRLKQYCATQTQN
jgi:hypothetical protein